MDNSLPTSQSLAAKAEERRRHARFPIHAEGTAWSKGRVATEPFVVTVTDISLAGMMMHTRSSELGSHEPGDVLLLGFPDPGSDHPVSLTVELIWKSHGLINLFGPWTFGVTFCDTPDSEIRKLLDPAAHGKEPLPES